MVYSFGGFRDLGILMAWGFSPCIAKRLGFRDTYGNGVHE